MRLVLVPLLALTAVLATPARAACPVFVLERQGADVVLRKELLAEGEVAVYSRDARAGFIDLILPVGPGRSAAFVRLDDHDRVVVRYSGGKLAGHVRREQGDPVALPSRTLEDLRLQDIRVSVTLADSLRRAFHITGYDSARADAIGPAENMFAGQLPAALTRTGIVVQTDTWASAPAARACGIAPLERERWLFARGARADGVEGWFVVDLGAAESVVARGFVPDSQRIEPIGVTEHSAAGTRRLPYAPAGATGSVQGVAGSTTFGALSFGSVRFDSAGLTVLEQMPDVFGRPVVGILGLDLLRGCTHLRLELARDARTASLVLDRAPSARPAAATVPFAWVASHLMVRGTLAGRDTRWILDSGAPGMVLDSVSAPPPTHDASGGATQSLRGLDGASVAGRVTRLRDCRIGSLAIDALEARVAPLPVFAPLREPGVALGVLGLAELARTEAIEVDFAHGVVRWLGARARVARM